MTLHVKPLADELEISVFGPGVGECVVVHLGSGRWMVVDSCLDDDGVPVALTYLKQLGLDVATDVVRLVVTHWHDDHTKGMADVFEACGGAELYCSHAMGRQEFFELIAAAHGLELEDNEGSGISEMAKLFRVLRARRAAGTSAGRTLSPRYADANTVIFRDTATSCHVEALSPSSTSYTRSLAAFAPTLKAPKRALPNPGPNELSIVLHVQLRGAIAILGADLEVGTSNAVGWRAVMANANNPRARASIIKVSHHGSTGADHPPAWAALLTPDAVAAVTSFSTSGIPRPSDIARIKARGHGLLHTTPSDVPRARFDRTTERILDGIAIRERRSRMGHVRLRAQGATVTTELFGAAGQR